MRGQRPRTEPRSPGHRRPRKWPRMGGAEDVAPGTPEPPEPPRNPQRPEAYHAAPALAQLRRGGRRGAGPSRNTGGPTHRRAPPPRTRRGHKRRTATPPAPAPPAARKAHDGPENGDAPTRGRGGCPTLRARRTAGGRRGEGRGGKRAAEAAAAAEARRSAQARAAPAESPQHGCPARRSAPNPGQFARRSARPREGKDGPREGRTNETGRARRGANAPSARRAAADGSPLSPRSMYRLGPNAREGEGERGGAKRKRGERGRARGNGGNRAGRTRDCGRPRPSGAVRPH